MGLQLGSDFTAQQLRDATKSVESKKTIDDYVKVKSFILSYVNTRSNKLDNKILYYHELTADALSKLVADGFKVESTRDRDGFFLTISW